MSKTRVYIDIEHDEKLRDEIRAKMLEALTAIERKDVEETLKEVIVHKLNAKGLQEKLNNTVIGRALDCARDLKDPWSERGKGLRAEIDKAITERMAIIVSDLVNSKVTTQLVEETLQENINKLVQGAFAKVIQNG